MTSIQPPQMSVHNAVHFRDPFVSTTPPHQQPLSSWTSDPGYACCARALTPPPEMQQEHRQHHGDRWQAYRPQGASYYPQEVSNAEFGRQAVSRPVSPARQPVFEDSQSRRGSHASNIALSFQIPRSVNDSGGSLSELAAEITCLFWFESADLLQRVEESPLPFLSSRQLIPDARPTTGFRKWVTTILSTTLVAQNVVLLALLFVYRLKKLNPTVKGKPGSEYRLLTVALMLGNKFLDDNTYTNRTWAEVSGINVGEVHIMEVEFLSNMKYCLFTSAEDWSQWQSLLGRFASFFDRATRPQPPAPILPPASSLQVALPFPSPPSSNQASPPYLLDHGHLVSNPASLGPTPAPSPLPNLPVATSSHHIQTVRKRGAEDTMTESPAKRVAGVEYAASRHAPVHPGSAVVAPAGSRVTLPSLSIPTNSAPLTHYPPLTNQGHQLPPLAVPGRPVSLIHPNTGAPGPAPILTPTTAVHTRVKSRDSPKQLSPFATSAGTPPGSGMPTSATRLHPSTQISPSYVLHQRNSPYRPVRNVSTLLYPPPSGALHHRPQNVEHNQMAYQQLGKPIQDQHSGRLPYISQNVWLDNNGAQAMTPVHHWPGFSNVGPHKPH
nr:meiotically up-regulated gene 80 protein [Quercus suber]